MKKEYIYIFIGQVFILLLELVFIYTHNDFIGDKTNEYIDLQDRIKKVKTENILLKEKYLEKASLTRISQEARKQGFIPGKYVYLKGE